MALAAAWPRAMNAGCSVAVGEDCGFLGDFMAGVSFPRLVVEDRARKRRCVAIVDFGASNRGGWGSQRTQFEVNFTAQSLCNPDHGVEGEVGVAAEDFGDVGGWEKVTSEQWSVIRDNEFTHQIPRAAMAFSAVR